MDEEVSFVMDEEVVNNMFFAQQVKGLVIKTMVLSHIKVYSHVTFAFFFGLCCSTFENANVQCKHHHLLPQNPFFTFAENATADIPCEQDFKNHV